MLEAIQEITQLPQELSLLNGIIVSIITLSIFYLLIEILLLPLKKLWL